MFTRKEIENILFLDIETASSVEDYELLSPRMKGLWDKKSKILLKREEEPFTPSELFTQRAAIFSEFGKVVTISLGYLRFTPQGTKLRLKSFFGPDEHTILTEFAQMANQYMAAPSRTLCAHNGKEFDYPYLGRRYLINQIEVPQCLRIQGKKPWEVNLLDTMELWKFGDYKSFTSLDLLTAILGVPSPKDDMDGSEVGRVFWEEKNYSRIKDYCEQDVLATAQVMLRMCREDMVRPENIEYA
ncbi:MAG: ribonuclease H-like domain-containing protein [Bacteroidia bacterium]|nr:ribonuclease H-like domain-containing protein [Bacteroidia bacterium]